MARNMLFTGSSVSVNKVLRLTPGGDSSAIAASSFQFGLSPDKMLPTTFNGFTAADIVAAWNDSQDALIGEITASVNGNSVDLTHDIAGEDFEVYITIDGQGTVIRSEIQQLTFTNAPTGGTFTLTYGAETTGNITYVDGDPATTAANIVAALEALTAFQTGDVAVASVGGSDLLFNVTFGGQYAGLNMSALTADFTNLTGGDASVTITTVQNGSVGVSEIQELSMPGFDTYTALVNEIQRFRITNARNGSFTITVPSYGTTAAISWDANRVAVKNALEALLGAGTVTVSGGPVSSGNWLTIEFIGSLAVTDITEITVDISGLNTTGSFDSGITVSEYRAGTVKDPLVVRYTLSGSPVLADHYMYFRRIDAGNNQPQFNLTSFNPAAIDGSPTYITPELVNSIPAESNAAAIKTLLLGKFAWMRDDHTTAFDFDAFREQILPGTGDGYAPTALFDTADITVTGDFTTFIEVTFGGKGLGYYFSDSFPQLVVAAEADDTIQQVVTGVVQSGSTSSDPNLGEIQILNFDGPLTYSSYRLKHGSTVTDSIEIPGSTLRSSVNNALAALNRALRPTWTMQYIDDEITVGVDIGGTEVPTLFAYPMTGPALQAVVESYAGGAIPSFADWKSAGGELRSKRMGAFGRVTLVQFNIATYNSYAEIAAHFNALIEDTFLGELEHSYTSLYHPVTGGTGFAEEGSDGFYIKFSGAGYQSGDQPLLEVVPDTVGGTDDAEETIETITNGGSVEQDTITGGTFDLGFSKTGSGITTWVTGIPFDVTAAALQTLINDRLGSGSVTCTGGALPGTAIEITFAGDWANSAVDPTQYRLSLEGSVGGSATNEIIRVHKTPETVENCYDFTIIPGRGTLALNLENNWDNVVDDCNWGNFNITVPGKGRLVSDYFKWVDCTALDIENVINEMFGEDVCRVYQTVHSQEWASVPNVYGGSPTSSRMIWYFRDVFRIVFHSKYASPTTITDMEFVLPQVSDGESLIDITPEAFMRFDAGGTDNDDFTSESQRVYAAFLGADSIGDPLHEVSIAPGTVASQELTFRYKLIKNYIANIYNEPPASATGVKRAITAEFPADMQVRFSWKRRFRENVAAGDTSFTEETLAYTDPMDWDSSSLVFQTALENLKTTHDNQLVEADFFGVGNVTVEGGLANSHLSEDAVEPEIADSYQDLRVTITGKWSRLPFDEYEYFLDMTLIQPASNASPGLPNNEVDADSLAQFNYPLVYVDVVSRPIPPLRSERQRIDISLTDFSGDLLVGYNDVFAAVDETTTAQELEDILNGLSSLGKGSEEIAMLLPLKWAKSVTVYGKTVAGGPMEVEFNGYGQQYSSVLPVLYSVLAGADPPTFLVTTTQEGVNVASEIQTVATTGTPRAGAFSLVVNGNTTGDLDFDGSAAELQALLVAELGADTVVCTGGPLPAAITCTFASSLGNLAAITLNASSLINAGLTLSTVQAGGSEASIVVTEVTRGNGSAFWDSPDNFRDLDTNEKVLPSSGDTVTIDDAQRPIKFGLRQRCGFVVAATGASTLFKLSGYRRTFLSGQKLYVYATAGSTLPTGLAAGYYYVRSMNTDGEFKLSTTADGAFTQVSDVGDGTFMMEVRELTLIVYSRFAGGQIGLPNRRSNGEIEYLARYLEMGFEEIVLGEDEGVGLSLGRFNTLDQPLGAGKKIHIIRTSSSSQADVPAVLLLTNNNTIDVLMEDGEVGIAAYSDETALLNSIEQNAGILLVSNAVIADKINSSPNAQVKVLRTTVADQIRIEG